jgi:hypothetical protein
MGIMTLRLSPEEEKAIADAAASAGMNKSEWVREAVNRSLFSTRLTGVRKIAVARAREVGILTEDDALNAAQ